MRRYAAKARPVSDPVASRNATIKMIQRCAKHQPQAQSFDQAHRTDSYISYTNFGIAASEGGPISPAIAIKEIDDAYIDRLLHPTHPVSLVPSDWYYLNGEWRVWTTSFTFVSPPDVHWFSLREQDPQSWDVAPAPRQEYGVSPVITASEIAGRWAEFERRLIAQFALPPGLLRPAPVPESEQQLRGTSVHITYTEN